MQYKNKHDKEHNRKNKEIVTKFMWNILNFYA